MAATLSTYSELQAAIASFCFNRTDLPVANLIRLAEDRLNLEMRPRFKEADASLTAVVDSRFIALPSGFVEAIACWIEESSGRKDLRKLTPAIITETGSGEPDYWAIDGENLAFEKPAGSAYTITLRCIRAFELTDADPTNALLTAWPSLYLSASLVEAGLWMQDPDFAATWNARFEKARDELNAKDSKSRKAPLRTDLHALSGDYDTTQTFENG